MYNFTLAQNIANPAPLAWTTRHHTTMCRFPPAKKRQGLPPPPPIPSPSLHHLRAFSCACGTCLRTAPAHRLTDLHKCCPCVFRVRAMQFFVVTVYVPNSGEKLVRLAYRTEEWDLALRTYVERLESEGGKPVVLNGDLNVAHL